MGGYVHINGCVGVCTCVYVGICTGRDVCACMTEHTEVRVCVHVYIYMSCDANAFG